MAYFKIDNEIVRIASFTEAEDCKIRTEAKKAELSPEEYIKQMALAAHVSTIDQKLLQQHTAAIDFIAQNVLMYTSNEKPDHWLFKTDLSIITELLNEIKNLERELIDEIRNVT